MVLRGKKKSVPCEAQLVFSLKKIHIYLNRALHQTFLPAEVRLRPFTLPGDARRQPRHPYEKASLKERGFERNGDVVTVDGDGRVRLVPVESHLCVDKAVDVQQSGGCKRGYLQCRHDKTRVGEGRNRVLNRSCDLNERHAHTV